MHQQQFTQMTSSSYVNVYLMEYTSKMGQTHDKINKPVEDKPGADEQISEEEDLEAEEKGDLDLTEKCEAHMYSL